MDEIDIPNRISNIKDFFINDLESINECFKIMNLDMNNDMKNKSFSPKNRNSNFKTPYKTNVSDIIEENESQAEDSY